jgi:putative transposase
MKRTRFPDEQIVGIMQKGAGAGTVREVCWKHVVTETTFGRWRATYGGLAAGLQHRESALATPA